MNSSSFLISQLFCYLNNLTDFNGFDLNLLSALLIASTGLILIVSICAASFSPTDAKCQLNVSTMSALSVISVFLMTTFSMELALIF